MLYHKMSSLCINLATGNRFYCTFILHIFSHVQYSYFLKFLCNTILGGSLPVAHIRLNMYNVSAKYVHHDMGTMD